MSQQATIACIEHVTPTIATFSVRLTGGGYDYLPGQWTELSATVDGHEIRGSYSMTSAPDSSDTLDFAVKASHRHDFTRWLHERAQPGDALCVAPARGTFVFESGMADSLVLIGGGVGVTPLISILRHVRGRHLGIPVTLIYSMSVPEEYLFRAELEASAIAQPNIRVIPVLSKTTSAEWNGPRGRIDRPLLARHLGGAGSLHYLCGPPGMVEDLSRILESLGVPQTRIVFEKWW